MRGAVTFEWEKSRSCRDLSPVPKQARKQAKNGKSALLKEEALLHEKLVGGAGNRSRWTFGRFGRDLKGDFQKVFFCLRRGTELLLEWTVAIATWLCSLK